MLGSRDKLERALRGESISAVVNSGKEPVHWTQVAGGGAWESRPATSPAGEALRHVQLVLSSPQEKRPTLGIGSILEIAASQADALGFNLRGKMIALDHDGVRHIIKGHGKPGERKRGQEPISQQDIARFDAIFNAAQLEPGDPPRAKDGSQLIAGSAKIDDWAYGFVVKVRRRDVVPYTLFKRRQK